MAPIVLTETQRAVLMACVAHTRSSFLPVTPDAWWRAGPPFSGQRAAFAAHLRALEQRGLLTRCTGTAAAYTLTSAAKHASTTTS